MENQEKVQISLSKLEEQINSGMKRKEIAEFYGLPESNVAKILKDNGLQIRKFHEPKYVIVDDRENSEPEEQKEATATFDFDRVDEVSEIQDEEQEAQIEGNAVSWEA